MHDVEAGHACENDPNSRPGGLVLNLTCLAVRMGCCYGPANMGQKLGSLMGLESIKQI